MNELKSAIGSAPGATSSRSTAARVWVSFLLFTSLFICNISLQAPAFAGIKGVELDGGSINKKAIVRARDNLGKTRHEKRNAIAISKSKASAVGLIAKTKALDPSNGSLRTTIASHGLSVGWRSRKVPGLIYLVNSQASSNGFSADELMSRIDGLKQSKMFDYVEPDWEVSIQTTPTDAAFVDGTLWGLRNTGQSGGTAGIDISAVEAWARGSGSPDVVIGVVDSGIRYTHQDLSGNMWINSDEIPANGIDDDGNGYIDDVHGINAINGSGDPFDDNDHGTHCAGTIAATAFGSGEHVGVAYSSKVMGLKFLSSSGSGYTSDAIEAIEYAIDNGADILSNSWGGGSFSQGLLDIIVAAEQAGIIFVAAAGNSALNNDSSPLYPSSYDVSNVISVAAIDRAGNLASFSNYGLRSVDIGAPGVNIFSSTAASDSSYASFSGTSMATPHVAGVAALILSNSPGLSVAEVRQRLLGTTTPLSSLQNRVATGGMVNADDATNVTPDDVMELSITVPPLDTGADAVIQVRVADGNEAVRNAIVSGNFESMAMERFRDDGIWPDDTPDDAVYTAQLTAPEAGSTVRLNIWASATGKQDAYVFLDLPLTERPVNDDFENRIGLPAGSTTIAGSNVGASSEDSEPRNPSVAGGASVWWEWSAPAGLQSATISTIGSDYDTTLAVYSGSSLDSLTLLASNDDFNGLQSSVTINPVNGQVYQIQVDGYRGLEGAIQLNYPEPGETDGRPVITVQPTDTSVLLGAPFELSVQAAGTGPLNYQWYRSEQSDATPIFGATQSTFSVDVSELADQGFYYVVVSNQFGTVTSAEAFVSVSKTEILPANDDFVDATLLTGRFGRATGANIRATGELFEPSHAGVSSPLASIWYEWNAPESGSLVVNTSGSDFDTTLGVYTGTDLRWLTAVASNDDAPGLGAQSEVVFPTRANTSYWIAVDGYSDREGQVILNYEFASPTPIRPSNDNFSSRAELSVNGVVGGSNVGATSESGEPNHDNRSIPIASVWWSWVAPSSGRVTFSTAQSSFDTTLAVYTGNSVSSLTLVASNDDSGGNLTSQTSFLASEGVEYAVAVDGYGSSEGNVTLRASFERFAIPQATPPVVWQSFFSVDPRETTDIGDFNGDGLIDIITFTRSNPLAVGDVYVALSEGNRFSPTPQKWADWFAVDADEEVVVGDYNGDGMDDLATWLRSTTDQVYVALSTGTGMDEQFYPWLEDASGLGRVTDSGDVMYAADVNGDRRDDLVLFARSAGQVYVSLSTGIGFSSPTRWHNFFSVSTFERPGLSDFDGDGRADIITFATDSPTAFGDVYVSKSLGFQFGDRQLSEKWHDWFSISQDQIVRMGDINNDGRIDIFTFMPPPSGEVYLVASLGGSMSENYRYAQYGVASGDYDEPRVGDVNGDGIADVIIFDRRFGVVRVSISR